MSDHNFAAEMENQNIDGKAAPADSLVSNSPKLSQAKPSMVLPILAVLLIASLALNGYFLWVNTAAKPVDLTAIEEQAAPVMESDQTAVVASAPASPTAQPAMVPADQLDQWLQYQQPGIAIQLKYLDTFSVQTDSITDGYGVEKKVIAFQNNSKFEPEGFDVVVQPGTQLSKYLLDTDVSPTTLGGQPAVYAELPNGYSDMGSTTRPMVIVETIYKGNNYTFRFVGLSDYNNEFVQQVLKTVVFK